MTDLTIELEDDDKSKQAGGDNEIVVDKKEEAAVPSLEEALKVVQANLEEEKKRSQKLEAEAEEARKREAAARNEISSVKAQADDANLKMVEGAIANIKTRKEQLKAALKSAWSNGDYDKAAEIQDQIADNSARLLQLENGRRDLEEAIKNPPQVQRAQINDPADAYIANVAQNSPRSAAWLKEHKEYITNPQLQKKMMSAHYLAEAEGYTADTKEYLDFVETRLGLKKEPEMETVGEGESPLSAASAPAQRSAPPAAPPSRAASPGTNKKVVRLTRAQLEAAEISGLTPEEYAANLARGQ